MGEPSCHTGSPEALVASGPGLSARAGNCACGFDSPPSARFCAGCGRRLKARFTSGGTAGAPEHEPLPVDNHPPHQRRQVTVLFADIANSTEQIAQLAPEQAMHRLQPAIKLMCEAVERFDGTVMRTLGDGVMALFGAPAELESHAHLACASALHMQAEFARSDSGLSIRVGLHSGWVACDAQPHDGRTGGLAHGLTIHLASRVQNLASPGGVAITHDCHSLVTGQVDVEPMGPRHLKGVPEPVEIFRLAGFKGSCGIETGYARSPRDSSGAAPMRA
ncbi:MAG: adenylate/guanylate cyclase protein [Ramlibacter sp.]|nr:adenylate/guanylate cyclase protein [Ramlibacter sp.]